MRKLAMLLLALTLAVVVALFIIIERDEEPPVPGVDRALRVQLQWFDQAQFAGLYVAQELGYYENQGLEVRLLAGSYNINPIQRVLTGEADIGMATGDQVLVHRARNLELLAFGAVFEGSLAAFMSHDSTPVLHPEELRGKTVGVYSGFDTENILLSLLYRYQVERDEVDIIAASSIQAFTQGHIDVFPVYVINEPIQMREINVPVELLRPAEFDIHYVSDTFFGSTVLVEEYPDILARFLVAAAEGWRYAAQHPDEAIEMMLRQASNLSERDRTYQRAMLEEVIRHLNLDPIPFALDSAQWTSMERNLYDIEKIQARGNVDKLLNLRIAARADSLSDQAAE